MKQRRMKKKGSRAVFAAMVREWTTGQADNSLKIRDNTHNTSTQQRTVQSLIHKSARSECFRTESATELQGCETKRLNARETRNRSLERRMDAGITDASGEAVIRGPKLLRVPDRFQHSRIIEQFSVLLAHGRLSLLFVALQPRPSVVCADKSHQSKFGD